MQVGSSISKHLSAVWVQGVHVGSGWVQSIYSGSTSWWHWPVAQKTILMISTRVKSHIYSTGFQPEGPSKGKESHSFQLYRSAYSCPPCMVMELLHVVGLFVRTVWVLLNLCIETLPSPGDNARFGPNLHWPEDPTCTQADINQSTMANCGCGQ